MPLFALVDCNNFYASCERLFRPELKRKPIVVLSNNDGCVIARSNEAKALGIPMGAPAFQWEHLFRKSGVAVFSSNFALYGDISARIMSVLTDMAPWIEVYSIDEAFLDLTGVADPMALCHDIRERVLRWVGIPVSIGIARTKTLAKLANCVAKKQSQHGGVFDLESSQAVEMVLGTTGVGDVWGIGPRYQKQLWTQAVRSALDFVRLPRAWVRREMSVVGLCTQLELQGVSCLSLERAPAPHKSLLCSRTFGRLVTEREHLREAVTSYAVRVAEKLRREGAEATSVQVFINTPRHRENVAQHSGQATIALGAATAHTPEIIDAALRALDECYRPGFEYQKAGVMLLGLAPASGRQISLLAPAPEERQRQRALMSTLDAVNRRFGRGSLRYAITAAPDRPWHMRQSRRSPRYTTNWDELPRVGSPLPLH